MKVANKKATALVEGEVESVKMTVSERGMDKMCRMLRDQIYTEKPWAVVREILANAVDEHNAHGITCPVQVTLPTLNDPHFRVRDFAKGLSKEKVFSVFFQYFESTKDQDNSNIGGFGIGAKSPLAYADMFFVDSYHGGEKTSYASNVNGEASVAHKMGLTDSNETGIEVAVPVENEDFNLFYALVGEFIHFGEFEAQIKVTNRVHLVLPKSEWQIKNEFGKTGQSKSRFANGYHPIMVCIKGILYQVNDHPDLQSPFYNDLIVNIDAEEGVEIHPSRERIEMTKRNVMKVKQAIEAFTDHAVKDVKAKLDVANTAREKFAVEFDSSAFRNNATFNSKVDMPSRISTEVKNVERITWDGATFERFPCNQMLNSQAWDRGFRFTPDGQVARHSEYKTTDRYATDGSILFVKNSTIRTHEVIAYAEKEGIPSPLFVFRGEGKVDGWIEDKDFFVLRDDSVTKDEVAAIRKRYNPQGVQRGATGSGIPAAEVMGYKDSYRSTWNTIRKQDLDENKEILVIPLIQSREIDHKVVPPSWTYFKHKLLENYNILFTFQTHTKRMDKAKVDYKVLSFDFLESHVQEYLDSVSQCESLEVRNYCKGFKDYELKSLPDNCILAQIKLDFPKIKATTTNPVVEKLKKAQKRFDALTPLQKEIVSVVKGGWQVRDLTNVKAEGERILKEKIFI